MVLTTYQTIMVATRVGVWAGVDIFIYIDRVFFWQCIFDGVEKRNNAFDGFAFCSQSDF